MKSNRKNPRLLLILLTIYVFAQFLWWMFLLIRYNPSKKWMVLGEGSVFLLLLGWGIYTIYKTIRHEIELARMQKNFLLSVTHELKTPVAAGKLFLQTLLKRDFEKEKQQELLNKAVAENDRLTALIDKVLLATTLDNHEVPIFKTQLRLSELCAEVCQNISESIGNQHNWNISIEPNLELRGDSEAIRSVCQNLLENAIKYSPKNSLISVLLEQKNNFIHFSVSDEGSGIAKVDLPYIFNKFYRSGNEDTRSTKGTGLGLFIVKHLTGLHGGTVRVEPASSGGSKFIIELNKNYE